MNKIPKSYKIQKACSNCRYVFLRIEQDEDTIAYCGFGNSIRPLCGSGCGVLAEDFNFYLTEIKGFSFNDDNYNLGYEELMNKWKEWCEGREVELCGICDEYVMNI